MTIRAVSGVLLALALAACGGDSGPGGATAWRFALEEIAGSVQDRYAQRFKELVESASDGAVTVEIYPYGALGTSAQLTELTQTGAVELAFASAGHLGSVIPEVQAFVLHFAFSDDDAANAHALRRDGRVAGVLEPAYRERGLALLDLVPEGWMAWTAQKPLRRPQDFRGLKIRTMVSPLLVEAYKAYGANPTPMPYGEVYGALQLGMIDAQENPVFAIQEMKFHEVQKALTCARHLPFVASLVANPRFVDDLDTPQRAVLEEALDALQQETLEMARSLNAERLAAMQADGALDVVHLDDTQREAFRELAAPVRERYLARAGKRGAQVLDALAAELAEAPRADAHGPGC